MNALPPVGLTSAVSATPLQAAVAPASVLSTAADAVSLGGQAPQGVDMAKAAKILMARQGSEIEKAWTVPGTSSGSPVRGPQGEIYIARSQEDEVVSLDPTDGHVLWTATPGGGHTTPPLLTPDGTLLVGGKDNQLYALDRTNGEVLWSVPVSGGAGWPFMGKDGRVYMSRGGSLCGFDLQRREVVSETPLQHNFEDRPVVGKDGTIYGGGHDGDLYALEPGTGAVKWHTPSGGMLRNSPAIGPDGTVYAGCIGKDMVAFDPADGHEKWRFPTPHWLLPSPVVMDDGTVLAGCNNGDLYALDPATGKKKWCFTMDGEVRTEPAPSRDGVIYAVSDRNTLYGIDANAGTQLWSAKAPSYVHCPLAPDGRGSFVFGSNDHTLVAMRDPATTTRVAVEEAVMADPSTPAPAPTIEVEDGWIVVGGVRVPVRPDEG